VRHLLRAASPVLTLAAGLVLACGAVPAGSHSPPVSQRVLLHEADAGHQVTLQPGDTVELVLSEPAPVPGSSLTWSATSSAPAVLRPDGPNQHGTSRDGSYVADFVAAGAGSADLTAQGVRRCEAMLPSACQQPRLTFPVVVR